MSRSYLMREEPTKTTVFGWRIHLHPFVGPQGRAIVVGDGDTLVAQVHFPAGDYGNDDKQHEPRCFYKWLFGHAKAIDREE